MESIFIIFACAIDLLKFLGVDITKPYFKYLSQIFSHLGLLSAIPVSPSLLSFSSLWFNYNVGSN